MTASSSERCQALARRRVSVAHWQASVHIGGYQVHLVRARTVLHSFDQSAFCFEMALRLLHELCQTILNKWLQCKARTPTCAAGDRTRSAEVCYTAGLSNAGCANRLRRQAKEERCWLAPSWDRRKQCIYLSTDINSSCGHSIIIMWISQTPWSPSVNHLFECILLLNFALGMKSRHNVAQQCIYLNYFYSPQPHNCLSTALFHRRDSGMNDVRCNGRAIEINIKFPIF